eukprot:scaffold257755_cov32-Tisochrysis_lutea.AAC.2
MKCESLPRVAIWNHAYLATSAPSTTLLSFELSCLGVVIPAPFLLQSSTFPRGLVRDTAIPGICARHAEVHPGIVWQEGPSRASRNV